MIQRFWSCTLGIAPQLQILTVHLRAAFFQLPYMKEVVRVLSLGLVNHLRVGHLA